MPDLEAKMANEQQQFEGLVGELMSPQNDLRNNAEVQYNAIPEATKLQFLVTTLVSSSNMEIRTMAAVLLRRLLSNIEKISTDIPQEVQVMFKSQLVQVVQQEKDPNLLKKVCDAVAELAKCYLDEDGNNLWPEILKFLFDCCNAPGHEMREVALQILCAFPGIFGNEQDKYLQVIKEMLGNCMQAQNPESVRVLAAKATCIFLTECVEEKQSKLFADLMPGVLQAIQLGASSGSDTNLLKCFVELVEGMPKLLRHSIPDMITLMLQLVSNSNLDDSIRHLALESIVTLSESAPSLVRKFGTELIAKIIPEMLALMVDLEDEPDWSVSDVYEDEEEDSNPVAGESSLDRFTCGIGGKVVLPHIISTIPSMLQHADWRYRHAALMAISAVAEGCRKQMEPFLGNVVESVTLPYLLDQHPRVRYAACNALGQLASDFSDVFQRQFHAQVIPGLIQVMVNDAPHPRVQAHAAAALVNFCEDCPQNVLEPYLDGLVEKLEMVLTSKIQELLQRGTKLVLEQVLTTIATVADTAEAKFVKYYDRFMPSLKYIFSNATSKELRLLRGKTIECISLIGLAVGAEKFLPDASEVMQLLLKTQTDMEDLEADDPQISYMISAWARMCKIIGRDFVQYLPVVMPPVLKAAQIKPEVALLDVDDPQNAEIDDDEGWEFVNLGEQQKFGIKTAGLEDKSTACQMLVHYAKELKEGFADYAEQAMKPGGPLQTLEDLRHKSLKDALVVKIMVPLLKFYFHETVRVTAAESLPYLLECASIRGDEYLRQMWSFICPELLKAIESEPDEVVIPEMMESFAKCVEKLGVGYIDPEHLTHLGQIFHEKIEKHLERQAERLEKRKEEDYDEEVEEDLQDEHDTDEYNLSKVSDVMHALFKTHKEALLPFFEQLLPDYHRLLDPSRPSSDRQWALCIFDDLLEYTGPASVRYQQYFLKLLLSYVMDRSAEVRQAAAYGCGVMAQFGGSGYSSACAEALPFLVQVINLPDSRSTEHVNSTENCISAVTKICKYNASNIDLDQVIPAWFSWLPITEDHEEAPHVYGYLCDLIEGNHPGVLGPNNDNLPRLVAVISEALIHEVFELCPEVHKRVTNVIRQIQSNGTVWKNCFERLEERHKAVLAPLITNGV